MTTTIENYCIDCKEVAGPDCDARGHIVGTLGHIRKQETFADVSNIRAAIASVIDRGWKCSTNCDVQHPWQFATELFPGDIVPNDEALKHRTAFIDAVIKETAKLQGNT